jgi:hypothetical protein
MRWYIYILLSTLPGACWGKTAWTQQQTQRPGSGSAMMVHYDADVLPGGSLNFAMAAACIAAAHSSQLFARNWATAYECVSIGHKSIVVT